MRIYTDVPTVFSGVTVDRESDNITVSLSNGETATITFHDLKIGKVTSYEGAKVVYRTTMPGWIAVCISGHNKVPYIQEAELCIQNETITGTKTYSGKVIKIGANVTDSKSQGPVVIKSGAVVNFQGNDVQIHPGTTIELGANVNIKTQ